MYNFQIFPQALYAVIASFGSFIFGAAIGWSAPVGPKFDNQTKFTITKNEMATAAAMVSLGGFFACFISGFVRNRYGTKLSTIIFTFPSLLGWGFLMFAQSSWMVILGRFFVGFAAGAYSFNTLTYIGEISSKQIRGILLSFYQINLEVGILFIYVLGAVTDLFLMNTICSVIVIMYGVAFIFLPETPMYLMTKGQAEESKKSLIRLRGVEYNFDNEMAEIEAEINEINESKLTFLQEIKNKATRKAFIMISLLFFFFQMSGINAILFYMTTILIDSGISFDPYYATAIAGFIQLISIVASTFVVDRHGRKILMILSNIVMITGLIGIGIYFQFKDSTSMIGLEFLPLVFLCIFLIGFSFGVGSVTFVLVGELFSLNAKKLISPIAQSVSFIMSFLIAMFFPAVGDLIGIQNTFYIFAGCCFLSLFYIIIFLPETKGKSLYEIQKLLTNEK